MTPLVGHENGPSSLISNPHVGIVQGRPIRFISPETIPVASLQKLMVGMWYGPNLIDRNSNLHNEIGRVPGGGRVTRKKLASQVPPGPLGTEGSQARTRFARHRSEVLDQSWRALLLLHSRCASLG
jgi:hypothetical protein